MPKRAFAPPNEPELGQKNYDSYSLKLYGMDMVK